MTYFYYKSNTWATEPKINEETKNLWKNYLLSVNKDETRVDPNDFILYGYKALVTRRQKLFDEIGENWGIRVNFNANS